MIVRGDGLGVPQTSHSALAGRLAEAWAIPPELPAQDLRVAATLHDIGWLAWEQAPRVNPETGRPYAFHELPGSEHAAIWTLGTDAASTWGRWVALLVSLHCTRLMGWRQEAGRAGPEVDALVDRERERQRGLRAGLDDAIVEAASDLIARWDGLSLELCGGKTPDLDPWPFTADAVPLTVDAVDLATREWRTLDVSVEREP